MLCNNCGRQTNNEEANFCDYCGHSFREHKPEIIKLEQPKQETIALQTNPNSIENLKHKPISLLNWLASYGILLVPIVGIVMLVVWAIGKNTSTTKKNWARATLIFVALMMLYLVTMMNMLGYNSAFQDYMNGSIGLDELMNSVYNMN